MLLAAPAAAQANARVQVAVAANFTEPMKEIAAAFEKSSGHKLLLSFGATGQFYAQISQGAPFEVLLSADTATPSKAVSEGYAVAGTAFTYAIGKLVLYSTSLDVTSGEAILRAGNFDRLAIANPATAPYGAAAVEVLKALGVHDRLQAKLVRGNNIGQTFHFVDTGNAELGFVALSQVAFAPVGTRWTPPESLYSPIRQDAVLLRHGAAGNGARSFLSYLKSEQTRAVIARFGYGTPND